MPRAAAFALLGLGLLLQGCYAARIDSVSYADYESKAAVHARVWGLWPYVKDCSVVCEFEGWKGSAGVLMTANAPQPEGVRCEIDRWERVTGPDPGLPRNIARARFVYRGEILHEAFVPAPRWTAEFIEAGNIRRAGAGAGVPGAGLEAVPGPGRTGAGASSGSGSGSGGRLSRDIDLPTPHDPTRDIVTTVGQGYSPQYARVILPPGKAKVVIDVRSEGDPRSLDLTWWRVEVLDQDGVPTGVARQDYVRPGDETRTIDAWTFDGRPRIIKVASASATGDRFRIRFERAD